MELLSILVGIFLVFTICVVLLGDAGKLFAALNPTALNPKEGQSGRA